MSVVRQNSHYISCQSVGKKLAVVEVCVGKVDRVRSRHSHQQEEAGGAGEQHLLHQDTKDIQPAPLSHSQQYGEWGEGGLGPYILPRNHYLSLYPVAETTAKTKEAEYPPNTPTKGFQGKKKFA